MKRNRFYWLAPVVLLLSAQAAPAQTYPSRPIRAIVPFSPGSGSDIVARLIGPKLYESWGQQVVVDNRPSGGGIVAGGIVAAAAPDGHTIMITSSQFAGTVALYDKLPYDPLKDFTGVAQVGSTPFLLVVAPGLGVTSAQPVPVLPEAPTIAEAALPGFECDGWYGVFVPSRTPRAVVTRLAQELSRILQLPEVKERYESQGAIAKSTTPEEFGRMVRDEIALRTKVFRAAGAKPD
jgi:tripartite-type tricarboxylate transporter receptor subunit TctC